MGYIRYVGVHGHADGDCSHCITSSVYCLRRQVAQLVSLYQSKRQLSIDIRGVLQFNFTKVLNDTSQGYTHEVGAASQADAGMLLSVLSCTPRLCHRYVLEKL